jgi:hypothetical protein
VAKVVATATAPKVDALQHVHDPQRERSTVAVLISNLGVWAGSVPGRCGAPWGVAGSSRGQGFLATRKPTS